MNTYRIVFLGDVVGRPGRLAVANAVPLIKSELDPLFLIINAENAASGVGITPDIANELFKLGADAITLGNHAFHKKEILPYLDQGRAIVRPANLPPNISGVGHIIIEKDDVELLIVNLCGRTFMDGYDDPFREMDRILAETGSSNVFVDFHAEATSEKIAFGWHVDSRVSAVVGTHTHVTTADQRVLPGGTAYITDVGMCGPVNSVLGMDRNIILERFRTTISRKFEVANEPGVICGVTIDVERETGRAKSIRRIISDEGANHVKIVD
jgi:2',3'-cyclic-nucleotide 2'-phosphodiesterase